MDQEIKVTPGEHLKTKKNKNIRCKSKSARKHIAPKKKNNSQVKMAALTIERCLGEFRGMLTGGIPTMDCVKFGVSKGLVRRSMERRERREKAKNTNKKCSMSPLVADADDVCFFSSRPVSFRIVEARRLPFTCVCLSLCVRAFPLPLVYGNRRWRGDGQVASDSTDIVQRKRGGATLSDVRR